MILGILECDHVKPDYRYIAGDYADMFSKLIPGLIWKRYNVVNGILPKSVEACDAYLCTGSRHSVYDDLAWIHRLTDFIHSLYISHKKFIGICFGHQILAHAVGGSVQKAETGWCVGNHQVKIIRHKPWMEPKKDTIKLQMMCQDQVVQIPKSSRHLASSTDCPYAMFGIGDYMLGIQGHPEFPNTYTEILLLERLDKIGEQKVRKALESLSNNTDSEIIQKWILNFLKTTSN